MKERKRVIKVAGIAAALIAVFGAILVPGIRAIQKNEKEAPMPMTEETIDLKMDELLAEPAQEMNAATTEFSGICGDNAEWSFDPTTGTLSIRGSGMLYDFGRFTFDAFSDEKLTEPQIPWDKYDREIYAIEIAEGIENIPDYAFINCRISELSIPSTVETIGEFAFAGCNALKTLEIKGSTRIKDAAFMGCDALESVTLRAEGVYIGAEAFVCNHSLRSFTGTPDFVDVEAFSGCDNIDWRDVKAKYDGYSWYFGEGAEKRSERQLVARSFEPMNENELVSDQCYVGTFKGETITLHIPQLHFETEYAKTISEQINAWIFEERYPQLEVSPAEEEKGTCAVRWAVASGIGAPFSLIVEDCRVPEATRTIIFNFNKYGDEVSQESIGCLAGVLSTEEYCELVVPAVTLEYLEWFYRDIWDEVSEQFPAERYTSQPDKYFFTGSMMRLTDAAFDDSTTNIELYIPYNLDPEMDIISAFLSALDIDGNIEETP